MINSPILKNLSGLGSLLPRVGKKVSQLLYSSLLFIGKSLNINFNIPQKLKNHRHSLLIYEYRIVG